jgi:hypothetical protein
LPAGRYTASNRSSRTRFSSSAASTPGSSGKSAHNRAIVSISSRYADPAYCAHASPSAATSGRIESRSVLMNSVKASRSLPSRNCEVSSSKPTGASASSNATVDSSGRNPTSASNGSSAIRISGFGQASL